jgi:hypothetical protein
MAVMGRRVISWTRRRSAVFFYLVSGRLEDFHLQRLAPQRPLELFDPLLGVPQQGRRDHILVGGHGRLTAPIDQVLPAPHHRRRDVDLPAQL